MSDVRLYRYNAVTLKLMKAERDAGRRELSTPGRPVTPYFIRISFRDIQQPEARRFFNRIPTNFSLSGEQVDRLIAAGRELRRNNPDFQQFPADVVGH